MDFWKEALEVLKAILHPKQEFPHKDVFSGTQSFKTLIKSKNICLTNLCVARPP